MGYITPVNHQKVCYIAFIKSSAKTIELKKPRVQGLSVALPLFSDIMATACTIDVILTKIDNVFIIWSTLARYEELTGGYSVSKPVRNGVIF